MELVIAKIWHPEINPWEAEAAPAAAPAGLTFWGRKYMLYFGICLVGWLVGWFVGYTSTMNQRSFDVKRLREIPEPTGSIAFHCFNWTLSMSCAYQELWTLLKWKRWEQSLEPSRRSWNRRPRGNEMHCRHSFWPNHFVFWVSIYLYVLDYKIWYHEYI